MPVNNYNPIVEGLINAYGLSERIQRMTQARAAWDEEERRTRRREGLEDENRRLAAEDRNYALKERERKRTREDKATAYEDLERGIALTQSRALEELEPGQTTRKLPDLGRDIYGSVATPIGPTVEYEGRRFAQRPRREVEHETEADAIRRARALTGEKLRETAGAEAIREGARNRPVEIPGVGMVPLSLGGAALGVVRGREANKAATERGAAANVSREKAAGIRADAKEKGAATDPDKANRTRREDLQKQIDALQGQANEIHAQLTSEGAAMPALDKDDPDTAVKHQKSAAAIKGLKVKVKGVERLRDELIARKKKLEPAAGAGAPAKYDPATGKLGGAGGGQRVLKYNPATGKLE
jgi:hypothetical protein